MGGGVQSLQVGVSLDATFFVGYITILHGVQLEVTGIGLVEKGCFMRTALLGSAMVRVIRGRRTLNPSDGVQES